MLVSAFLLFKKDKQPKGNFKDATQHAILHLTGIESEPVKPGSIRHHVTATHAQLLVPVSVVPIVHVIQKIPPAAGSKNPKEVQIVLLTWVEEAHTPAVSTVSRATGTLHELFQDLSQLLVAYYDLCFCTFL